MRTTVLVCAIGLIALSVGLGAIAVAPDDTVDRFDPYHPTTILPIAAAGLRELRSILRGWAETTLFELRGVLQRTELSESATR